MDVFENQTINGLANGMGKLSGVPRNFVRGGVQQIQLRTENEDLGVAPHSQGFWRQL